MKVEELLAHLAEFGLEGNEAQAYYHLSRLGGATASELAQASDLSRTDVYRVMGSLEGRGLVERTVDKPTRFLPVPVDEGLDRVLAARQRETEHLREARDALVDQWPRGTVRSTPGEERVSIHKGRNQVEGLLKRLVDEARDEVLLVLLKRSLSRLDTMGVLDALAQRADDGLRVKVLTEVDASNLTAARRFARAADVRHLDLPAYHQLVIADAAGVALFASTDPLTSASGSGEAVLHLEAEDFRLAQEALFDELWAQGLDLDQRARELEGGAPAGQARVVRGHWILHQRLGELLYRARESARLRITAEDLEHEAARGLVDVLARRARDGVDVRVLVSGGPVKAIEANEGIAVRTLDSAHHAGDAERAGRARDVGDAGQAGAVGDSREAAAATGAAAVGDAPDIGEPGPLALAVDDREALVALHAGGQGDQARQWALWTTLPGEVAAAVRRFEAAWARAGK